MVTITEYDAKNGGTLSLVGLSSDQKPIKYFDGHKIINGSTYMCLDGGIFLYDQENEQWIEN